MGLFYDSTYLLVILAALIPWRYPPHEHDFGNIRPSALTAA